MRSIILLCLVSLAPFAIPAPEYTHKTEAEIARMTAAQRVDEWANEQVLHRFDLGDRHQDVIRKYLLRDGLAALPRMIEIMDEYDPTRFREGKGRRGERFDACASMLSYIDDFTVRLRASEEGRRAMNALERAIQRMQAAGYGQKDQHEWAQHGRFNVASIILQQTAGINNTDEAIKNTLRLEYKIQLSNAELLEFIKFLVARHAEYPSWSERDFIKIFDENGKPLPGLVVKKLQPFYEAYLEFKKVNS